MPIVTFRGREIECKEGETLRNVLKRAGLSPHNGKTKTFNCKGFASCGTCAVAVDGEVSDVGIREKARLLTPPHHPNYDLRLSCQTKVLGDVTVEKYPGAWGPISPRGHCCRSRRNQRRPTRRRASQWSTKRRPAAMPSSIQKASTEE